jgi:hypothetical protein
MTLSRERLARNQIIFRDVNERLRTIADALPDGMADYLCECSDVHCTDKIGLRLSEYEAVRAQRDCFFIEPGHERPEVEEVVDQNERYAIVRKFVPIDQVMTRSVATGAGAWPSDRL